MKKKVAFIFALLMACTDSTSTSLEQVDSRVMLAIDVFVPDVQIVEIPDISVDAWVNPCENIPNTHVRFCECNPTCCQQQTWYCPPTGTEIQAKYAVLDICDETLTPCDRN